MRRGEHYKIDVNDKCMFTYKVVIQKLGEISPNSPIFKTKMTTHT